MPNLTLLQAIQARLDASPVFAALTASGGVWVGGVPEDLTILPFVAIVHRGEVPMFDQGVGEISEEGHFDLIVTGRQPLSAVEALAAQVTALFDPDVKKKPVGLVELTIQGAAVATVRRLDYRVERLKERAADSAYVYQVTLPYQSFVMRGG